MCVQLHKTVLASFIWLITSVRGKAVKHCSGRFYEISSSAGTTYLIGQIELIITSYTQNEASWWVELNAVVIKRSYLRWHYSMESRAGSLASCEANPPVISNTGHLLHLCWCHEGVVEKQSSWQWFEAPWCSCITCNTRSHVVYWIQRTWHLILSIMWINEASPWKWWDQRNYNISTEADVYEMVIVCFYNYKSLFAINQAENKLRLTWLLTKVVCKIFVLCLIGRRKQNIFHV